MVVIPPPFDTRPRPAERIDVARTDLEVLVAHLEFETAHLQRVHLRQELRRRVELERAITVVQEGS